MYFLNRISVFSAVCLSVVLRVQVFAAPLIVGAHTNMVWHNGLRTQGWERGASAFKVTSPDSKTSSPALPAASNLQYLLSPSLNAASCCASPPPLPASKLPSWLLLTFFWSLLPAKSFPKSPLASGLRAFSTYVWPQRDKERESARARKREKGWRERGRERDCMCERDVVDVSILMQTTMFVLMNG